MKHPPQLKAFGPVVNRFSDVLQHTSRFSSKGVSRLAREAGVHPSSLSRLLNNKINPSFALVARLTAAVEKEIGYRIDPRELISENGIFADSVCGLVGCRGCSLTPRDEFGRPKFSVTDPAKGAE